nr:MAG TPA_asm: tail fiber protein [Caudoviricetes sp.]
MAERNFSAKLAGKFVDDDDLIRTGRAWVEIDGFDFLHIPVPTGFDETMNVFEAQAEQVAKDAAASGKYASAAKSSASAAASSASKAAGAESRVSSDAQKAQDGATRAETAAGNAKQSATNAEDAARRASNSSTSANKSSVWVSEAEQRTKKSASAAAGSASSAKQDADRAANIANSTSWSGDRLTVNGKTSPSLTGPKGDRGTSGASTWDAVTDKPSTFPPSSHTHRMADISDLPEVKPVVANRSIVQRWSNGDIEVPINPGMGKGSATSKEYVDTAIASEKARTIGMVWMVETEDQAQAKETSCQKGDFIQVAQTGNIYQVV